MERKGVHQVFARNSIPLTKRKNKKERKKFLVYILATKKTRCFHSLSTGDVSGRSPPESATNSSLGKKGKNLLIHFLLFFHRFLYTQKKGKPVLLLGDVFLSLFLSCPLLAASSFPAGSVGRIVSKPCDRKKVWSSTIKLVFKK
jgi:hypothetical protein